MKKINVCDKISDSAVTKTDIKELISKTFYKNEKENCVDENEYIPTRTISGCSGNAQKLAEIHTHPRDDINR